MGGEPKPRQRKFAPRSRQGCLTCRTRRKRCDGQHPECQNCTRLNLKCTWQRQRTVVPEPAQPEELSLELPSRVDSPQRSLDSWDSLPGEDATKARHLLQYYIEAFVPSVSVATTPQSFYTSLYIPMAFESEGMLDAIVAVSSAQLARRSSDPEKARLLRGVSFKHEKKCLMFLRNRISSSGQPVADTYQVVAITLLLVGLEALTGNKTTKWLNQLQCARKILNSMYHTQNMTSWEVDSLRRHFTYYDVMASVMGPVSKVSPPGLETNASPFYTPPSGLTIDPLMGISDHLCSLVCRIQYLTAPNPAFPNLTKAAFCALENDIKQWKYESPLSSSDIDMPIALDLIALAEAYRLAALIQLYRTSEAYKHLVPACASRAMQFITRIPQGSPAESSLLYPMLLVGAELDTESDISACFEKLTVIQQRNRYENVANLRQVLQEVWRSVLNGDEKKDWEDVLKEWNWSFSLG